MRQMHHWACDIFVGAIVVHMARVFFTGAFRKPRELNWTIGLTLLILTMAERLPRLLAARRPRLGHRHPHRLLDPAVGALRRLLPGLLGLRWELSRYGGHPEILHPARLIVPLVIMGLVGAHLFLLVRQKHTQFPGEGRTEKNVVGSPMFPVFMAKTTGFLFIVGGFIALLGAFFQINPIWQFGQYRPRASPTPCNRTCTWPSSTGRCASSRPGSSPAWGHTRPFEVFIPAVLFPGIVVQHRLRLAAHRTQDSPATTCCTTCSIDRVTVRSAPPRASACWCSWRCSSSRARPTSSRSSSTSR